MAVYYVTATGRCPDREAVCHPLSYYIDYKTYWPLNLTLIFLQGEHIMTDRLVMMHLNIVMLKGDASKPLIKCYSRFDAFSIHQINELYIQGLQFSCSLSSFNAISRLTLFDVIAQGLQLNRDFTNWFIFAAKSHVSISNSEFKALDLKHSSIQLYGNHLVIQVANTIMLGTMLYVLCDGTWEGDILLNNVSVSNTLHDGGVIITCEGYCAINLTDVTIDSCRIGMDATVVNGDVSLTNVRIVNMKREGLIVMGYQNQLLLDNVTIANNSRGGIIVFAITILFYNHPSIIINNFSPENGGGLMLLTPYSVITSTTEVYFINNTAQKQGGAIYVARDMSNIGLSCTFNRNFTPIFSGNRALISSDNVHNGIYWNCSVVYRPIIELSVGMYLEDVINCSSNPTLKYFPQPIPLYISTDAVGVCLCSNGRSTANCSNRVFAYNLCAGQFFTLPLVAVGICAGISPAALVTSYKGGIKVLLVTVNQETERICKNFTYQIKQDHIANGSNGQIEINVHQALNLLKSSALTVNVTLLPCPYGLELKAGVCQCSSVISRINGVNCDVNLLPRPISRFGNNWLYYDKEYNCTVAYANCPFEYCKTSMISFSLIEPDIQCVDGRSGMLCGKCQQGLSLMLGSDKCGHCSNKYLSIVVAFIIAGIALVTFLLISNMTVSVGSINGLLFYANVIKLNHSALFSGVNLPVLSQFIAWLNLDLGIETCFFNGLDGYWKTWLQFSFSFTMIAVLLLCCKFSTRLSHLLGRNVVAVLSTLILMAHSKLLLAVRSSLMLSVIVCDRRKLVVWSVDANIPYLGHKHSFLFILSLFVMLIGLLYTIAIFSNQWMQRLCGRYCRSSWDPFFRFKPFLDAYTGPYKDKYRYWTGLLLIVRLLLTAVFSYTTGTVPQANNCITAITTSILVYLLAKDVYRSKILNILESFYIFNLGMTALLLALLNQSGLSTGVSTVLTAISISLSMIVFVCTVLAHLYIAMKRFCCPRWKPKLTAPFRLNFGRTNELTEEESLLKSVDSDHNDNDDAFNPPVINQREQLIFY